MLRTCLVLLALWPSLSQHLRGLSSGEDEACHTLLEGEDCYTDTLWAMVYGIYMHPEWYPASYSPASTFEDFQEFMHSREPDRCPLPCEARFGPSVTIPNKTFCESRAVEWDLSKSKSTCPWKRGSRTGIRYFEVGMVNNRSFDVIVDIDAVARGKGAYFPLRRAASGKVGVLNLNAHLDSSLNVTFSFVDSASGEELVLEMVHFTIMDLEESDTLTEFIQVGGFESYVLAEQTEVNVTEGPDGLTIFESTMMGDSCNDPTDPMRLKDSIKCEEDVLDQKKRAVTLLFSQRSSFSVNFGISCKDEHDDEDDDGEYEDENEDEDEDDEDDEHEDEDEDDDEAVEGAEDGEEVMEVTAVEDEESGGGMSQSSWWRRRKSTEDTSTTTPSSGPETHRRRRFEAARRRSGWRRRRKSTEDTSTTTTSSGTETRRRKFGAARRRSSWRHRRRTDGTSTTTISSGTETPRRRKFEAARRRWGQWSRRRNCCDCEGGPHRRRAQDRRRRRSGNIRRRRTGEMTCKGSRDFYFAGSSSLSFSCKEAPKPGLCASFGDPHFVTFDGAHTVLMADRVIWLVKSQDIWIQALSKDWDGKLAQLAVSGPFIQNHVILLNKDSPWSISAYFDGEPILEENVSEFHMLEVADLYRNVEWNSTLHGTDALQVRTQLQFSVGPWPERFLNRPVGGLFLLKLPNDVELAVTGADTMSVVITMPSQEGGQSGFCGNFNGNVSDDFIKVGPSFNIPIGPDLENVEESQQIVDLELTATEDSPIPNVTANASWQSPDAILERCSAGLKASAVERCTTVEDERLQLACIVDVCASGLISAANGVLGAEIVMTKVNSRGIPLFMGFGQCLDCIGRPYRAFGTHIPSAADCTDVLRSLSTVAGVMGAQLREEGNCEILVMNGTDPTGLSILGGWDAALDEFSAGAGIIMNTTHEPEWKCWQLV